MSGEASSGKDVAQRIQDILESDSGEISIFRHLAADEMVGIADYFEVRRYITGEVVVEEGKQLDCLGIVIEGKLEARHRPSVEGNDMIIAHLGKGAHIGSVSSPGGRPAMATVAAEEETELLCIREERFDELADKHPRRAVRILKGVIEVLSIRLDNAIDRVVLLS